MKWMFTLLFFTFFINAGQAQSSPFRDKAIVLKRMIEKNHYSPREVNDSFSVAVFEEMINTADPRRLLFTAPEYTQLTANRLNLDDELNGKGWVFFDLFSALYKKSLLRADTIINKIFQKPFDYNANETISSSSSRERTYNFSADTKALTDRWSRYFKLLILDDVYDAMNEDSTKKMTFKGALTSLEPGIKEKIKRAELKSIKKILEDPNGYSTFVEDIYLNAIASSFDPHTNYFSTREKENFQAQLSTEVLSFGLDLEENDKGEIVIEHLVPGGPAWKSGELHKGDELLSLQWEGKQAVEINSAEIENVYDIIGESDRDRMVFKFQKPDGSIKIVLLRKEKINNEENVVKGFVLNGEKKIGYILLPGFYTEWENESGSSCANDVAKEIIKLKKEKIDGLILDVRFNGGGSLGEAIDMMGIFIEEGPLMSDKGRDNKRLTYKDPNRGTIYDGPMVLMVNGQSASASEILAGALQDYNRAVIVGSNTFGKSTMQQMFLLDTNRLRPFTGTQDQDVIKITMKKLYRLDGESAQRKGVKPDVALPDAFDALDYRESTFQNALPSDTVKRNAYYKPLSPLPVAELSRQSNARVLPNKEFQAVNKFIEQQKQSRQQSSRTIPLKWDSFEKWAQENEPRLVDEATVATKNFTAGNHSQDKQVIQNDPFVKEVNDTWLKNIDTDFYIQEAFLVLKDLIQLKTATTKN
ncbi:MAG: carboxy terminal-processing peptidase [Chitinophagaceae bacterium]